MTRSKNRPLAILAALALLVSMVACGTDAPGTNDVAGTDDPPATDDNTNADDYPSGRIQWVVHVAPGGGADVFTRQLISLLEQEGLIDVPMLVDNKSGGGGSIAYNYVTQQTGDPYVLLSITPNFVSQWVRGESPDPVDPSAFTPIANLMIDDYVLYVNADSPYQTLSDLIEAARAAPGEINQGGGSIGASDHQAAFLIEQAADVDFNFVSFEGGGEAQTALMGGNVDFALGQYNEGIENLRANRLRALAVFTEERLEAAPDIPTAGEQGVDVTFGIARGVVAPGNIPDDAREFLVSMFTTLSEAQSYQDYVAEIASRPALITGQEYLDFLESEKERSSEVLAAMDQD